MLAKIMVSRLILSATLAAASPLAAASVELRVATLAPAGSSWSTILNQSAAEIKSKTAGRVTVKYYEGGRQGDERDIVRKLRLGELDGAALTSVGLTMIDESMQLLELPAFFTTIEEIDYVADKMWPYFEKKFHNKNFILGERGEVGWKYIYSNVRLSSLAEMRAQKIWQQGDDQVISAMFSKVGVNGVPLGVPEVDAALTSGRINACYGAPVAAVALQWYTKIKFATSMPLNFGIGATVYSESAFSKISVADRKIIEAAELAAGKKLRKAIRKENSEALKVMTRKGVEIVTTSVSMTGEFSNQARHLWQDLVGKIYDKSELDMLLGYQAEYQGKHQQSTSKLEGAQVNEVMPSAGSLSKCNTIKNCKGILPKKQLKPLK
jgi:TRAP-type transport system periplasmic protein